MVKKKLNNPFSQDFVKFEPVEHKYTDIEGNKYISVTQLLNLYVPDFDPTGIILYKCSQREGISKETLQQRWTDKKTRRPLAGRLSTRKLNIL